MYAESNVTSCICHKLGICTLTNPSVGDVIYQESRLHHPHVEQLVDYIAHSWIGICTLTNPSVGDVIYQESRLHHPHVEQLVDYITHSWIGQCANFKLVTDTGCHVTLRIHLINSMPTFDTLSLSYS